MRCATRIAAAGITPLAAALGFVLSRPEVDVAVIGVTALRQLEEILAAVAVPAAGTGLGRLCAGRCAGADAVAVVSLASKLRDMLGDGQRGGQARRFNAEQIDQARQAMRLRAHRCGNRHWAGPGPTVWAAPRHSPATACPLSRPANRTR